MWSPSLLLFLISTSTVSHASKDGPTTGNLQHSGIEDQYQASSLPHKRVKRVKIKEVSQLEPGEYESTMKIVEDCLTELKANKTRVEAELATARAQLTDANGEYKKAEKVWKDAEEKRKSEEENVDEEEESVVADKNELQSAVDLSKEELQLAQELVDPLLAGQDDKFRHAQKLQAEYGTAQRQLPDEIAVLKKQVAEELQPKFDKTKQPKNDADAVLDRVRGELKKNQCIKKSTGESANCAYWKNEERAARAAVAAAAVPYDAAADELRNATRSIGLMTNQLAAATSHFTALSNFVDAWLRSEKAREELEDARRRMSGRKRMGTNNTAWTKDAYEKKRDAAQSIVTSLEKKLADLDGEITKGEQQAKSIQQKIELSKETPEPFNEFTNPYAIILYVLIAITVVFVTVCMVRSCRKQRREKKNKKAVMNLPKPFRYKIPPNSNKDEGSGSDPPSNVAHPSKRDSNKDSGSDSSNVAQPSNRDSNKGSGSDSSSKAPQSSNRDRKRGSGSDSSSKAPQSSKRDRKRGSGSDSSSKAKSSKRDSKKGSGSDSSSKAKSSKRDSKKEKPSTPSSHSDETKRPSQRSSSEKKNNIADP